ncbi:40S ribosomal protein s11 [Podospora fimiseda]|uniref:Small ribosomal subunit protein uS17 n=1 Tax=Podospora fimiseda TaxID=252190 RepID=A0AAN7BTW4_9PEZI|nr:40S ribosomal protein s11 [Podospora fimiseda]
MATELTVQSERAFQKQPHIFLNSKTKVKSTRPGKGGRRWYKDVGLGFRTPKTAIEGQYIGMCFANRRDIPDSNSPTRSIHPIIHPPTHQAISHLHLDIHFDIQQFGQDIRQLLLLDKREEEDDDDDTDDGGNDADDKEDGRDKKCPFTGQVSIRGRILTGTVVSTKMHRTIIIRREYLHYIPKYSRYEKRHKNLAAHVSPAFRVAEGDQVTVGQCRPLSKTVRFNVLRVIPKTGKALKGFTKF